MNIYSLVRQSVRNSILDIFAVDFPNTPIIFSHSGGSEPSVPYVVINILSVDQKGHHSTSTLTTVPIDGVGELSVSAFYEVMVQYSFCGTTAGDMAHTFSHRVSNNPLTFLEQQENKLAYMRKSTIRRAPQKRDTSWIENFNIDITYNYVANEQQLVDVVEGFVISDETGDIPVIIKIPDTIVYP
ncbi:hypothetical protein D3C85_996080 [compost metagenome]